MRMSSPLSAMKVSLPQLRMYPVEKWGSPAASVGASCDPVRGSLSGFGSASDGDRVGRSALETAAECCTEPMARARVNTEPEETNGDMEDLREKSLCFKIHVFTIC